MHAVSWTTPLLIVVNGDLHLDAPRRNALDATEAIDGVVEDIDRHPRGGRQVLGTEDPAAAFEIPSLWDYNAPLIAPEARNSNPSRAQEDPTVVFFGGQRHVFMTARIPGKSAIEYCSFRSWEEADTSPRTILKVSDSDHGELIRDGWDETLTVDPGNLRFISQDMWEKHKSGREYSQFQWRIGMLTPVSAEAALE